MYFRFDRLGEGKTVGSHPKLRVMERTIAGTIEGKLMAVNETPKWQWKLKLLKRHQTSKRDMKETSTAMKWRQVNLSSIQNPVCDRTKRWNWRYSTSACTTLRVVFL